MRRLKRSAFWLVIVLVLSSSAWGLYNHHRGLPPLSGTGLMALAVKLGQTIRGSLDPAHVQHLAAQTLDPDSPKARLRALRTAIGCFEPDSGDIGGSSLNKMTTLGADGSEAPLSPDADDPKPGEASLTYDDAFNLDISIEDAVMPSSFEARVRAGARRTYEVWENWLGSDSLVPTQINLRLIGDTDRFTEVYGKADSEDWTTTGFYRIRSNEAVVLYTPQFQRTALSTAYHEISHLITAWHLGPTPPWLNEGIAEHFETMRLDWSTSQFPLNLRHLAVLKQSSPLSVDELTGLSRRDWGSAEPQRRYASAWALMSFLQGSGENMKTLRHVLREANAQRCSTPADLRNALATYPGGFAGLDEDLQRWLNAQLRFVSVKSS